MFLDFISIFIGGIFHEFGHAVAASALDCRLNCVGVFGMFVYPGAFVDMRQDDLLALPSLDQLLVYCAGAWHNVVLAAVAYLAMHSVPLWTAPLFVSNQQNGVTVYTLESSPLHSLFNAHDLIVGFDECPVRTPDDFRQCLLDRLPSHTNETSSPTTLKPGYCISTEQSIKTLATNDESSDCCEENPESGLQCFALQQKKICLKKENYEEFHQFNKRCESEEDCNEFKNCLVREREREREKNGFKLRNVNSFVETNF